MTRPFLGADEPPAYGVVNPEGTSPVVLICEHASLRIPKVLGDLGLPEAEIRRHIGWDIGAQALALGLSAMLDAPLFIANYSRLVVDLNRPVGNPSQMPTVSETTAIPGNAALGDAARRERLAALFIPFHDAVARTLDRRRARGQPTLIVAVHSFTPVFKGVGRPWHAGILFDGGRDFGELVLRHLGRDPGLLLSANEPYRIDADDYAIPVHGDARGLPAILLEIRNDLLSTPEGIADWTARLGAAIAAAEGLAVAEGDPARAKGAASTGA